jgi:hypothetical protein
LSRREGLALLLTAVALAALAAEMAHDRRSVRGYPRCFRPNVKLGEDGIRIRPRAKPFGPEVIRECERKYRNVVAR